MRFIDCLCKAYVRLYKPYNDILGKVSYDAKDISEDIFDEGDQDFHEVEALQLMVKTKLQVKLKIEMTMRLKLKKKLQLKVKIRLKLKLKKLNSKKFKLKM